MVHQRVESKNSITSSAWDMWSFLSILPVFWAWKMVVFSLSKGSSAWLWDDGMSLGTAQAQLY